MKRYNKLIIMAMLIMSLVAMTACGKNDKNGNAKSNENTEINNQGTITEGVENNSTNEDIEITQAPVEEVEDGSLTGEEYIPDFIHEGEAYGNTRHAFFDAGLQVLAPKYHEVAHGLQNFHVGESLTIGYYDGNKKTSEEVKNNEGRNYG